MKREEVQEMIQRDIEDFRERYNRHAPYFDSNECGLAVYDGISLVGYAYVRYNVISVFWAEVGYDILASAREFFSEHNTNWGVYRTQYQF